MTYESLADFISKKMRMSHLYQPVMLIELLERGGKCEEREIASSLVAHDESQIEYYTEITHNMVGRVLRNRGVVRHDKETKTYRLAGYDELTQEQKQRLIKMCHQRLDAFMAACGDAIFDHSQNPTEIYPGCSNMKC